MITFISSFEINYAMLKSVIVFDEVLDLDLLPWINFLIPVSAIDVVTINPVSESAFLACSIAYTVSGTANVLKRTPRNLPNCIVCFPKTTRIFETCLSVISYQSYLMIISIFFP